MLTGWQAVARMESFNVVVHSFILPVVGGFTNHAKVFRIASELDTNMNLTSPREVQFARENEQILRSRQNSEHLPNVPCSNSRPAFKQFAKRFSWSSLTEATPCSPAVVGAQCWPRVLGRAIQRPIHIVHEGRVLGCERRLPDSTYAKDNTRPALLRKLSGVHRIRGQDGCCSHITVAL